MLLVNSGFFHRHSVEEVTIRSSFDLPINTWHEAFNTDAVITRWFLASQENSADEILCLKSRQMRQTSETRQTNFSKLHKICGVLCLPPQLLR